MIDLVGPGADASSADQGESGDWQQALDGFTVKGTAVGSMRSANFLAFLQQAETGLKAAHISAFHLFLNDPVAFVRESGLLITILFIQKSSLHHMNLFSIFK